MAHRPMLMNVAIGKPATQSSVAEWSADLDAGGAVSGTMPRTFAFHTAFEDQPWWMVDLRHVYPIETIVIHNRLDMCQERASELQVEISRDGRSWPVVHVGQVWFTGGHVGSPLVLPLGCRVAARFVRISLCGHNALHLAQVEVIGNIGGEVMETYGLPTMPFQDDYSWKGGVFTNGLNLGMAYTIRHPTFIDGALRLIGLSLVEYGRLGNQIQALVHATALARRLRLHHIVLHNQQGLIKLHEPFQHDGIAYANDEADVPGPGSFLSGNYFFEGDLAPVIDDLSDVERYRIVQDIVRPKLMKPLPYGTDRKYPDELTIHFRSGDIFSIPSAACGYTQPPLGFYRLLVRHLLARQRITRVRLVFEDRGNPCIDPFIAFLQAAAIPHRLQSSTLEDDIVALVDSPLLTFGFGSFGPTICLLSHAIDTVFCLEGFSEGDFMRIPSIREVVRVRDRGAGYMRVGQWTASAEQRAMMVEYPESALEIVTE